MLPSIGKSHRLDMIVGINLIVTHVQDFFEKIPFKPSAFAFLG